MSKEITIKELIQKLQQFDENEIIILCDTNKWNYYNFELTKDFEGDPLLIFQSEDD